MSEPQDTSTTRVREAERYLQTLRDSAPRDTFFDVRYRTDHGFAQFFNDIDDPSTAETITQLGETTDVYIGVGAREQHRGRREDVAPTAMVWADCDTPESIQALQEVSPPPTMIVKSGTGENAHAYWALTEPVSHDTLEETNRAIADTLGADRKSTDAARILRPPGTSNHKHDPSQPVQLTEHTQNRYDPQEIIQALPEPAPPEPATQTPEHKPPTHGTRHSSHTSRSQDPLHSIAPADYVHQLTGQESRADGKTYCPFHPDEDPSLHVYPTPEQGWACYGCPTPDGKTAGGDIYNFASKLWDIPTKGKDFLDLRDRLDDTFDIER